MSRIPNKSESFKKDYKIETYIIKDDTGETKEYRLIDENCNVIAKLVEKDGEFNESSATTDAQNSGLFEDFAKKFGFKDDIQFTTMQSKIENIEDLSKSKQKLISGLKKALSCSKDKDLDKGYTPEDIEKLKDEYRPEDPKKTFVKKIKQIKEKNNPKDTSDVALERKVRERYNLAKENTLDYSKLNAPKEPKGKEAPTLDYSSMKAPAAQPPKWKRDMEIKRANQQKALDAQGKAKEAPRQITAIEEIRSKHGLKKSLELMKKLAKSSKLAKGDTIDIRTGKPLESKEEKMARVKQKLKNLQTAMARVKMATGDVKTVDHQEMKDYRPKDDLSKGDVVDMFNRKKKEVDSRSKEDKINDALKTHGRGLGSGDDRMNATLGRIKELMATKKERMAARSEEFRKRREVTAIPTEKKRSNDDMIMAREKEIASLDPNDPLYAHKKRFGVEKVENALKEAIASNKPYAKVDTGLIPNHDYKISNKIGTGKPEGFGDDPFGWHDSKHKVSKRALEHNHGYNSPVEIHTSSDLLSQDDYASSIPKGSKIHMYKQSDDNDEIGNKGWPSNQRLERAAQKLKSMGHDVKVHPHSLKMVKSDAPHAPSSPEDKAHDIQEQTSSVKSSLDVLNNSSKIREMFKHLRSLKNSNNHRSSENIDAGSLKKDMKVPIRD